MTRNHDIARAIRHALILAATAAAAVPAQAQDQGDVSTVVVTGSRISSPNLTSISPVSSLSTEDIVATGRSSIEDIINELPQAFAAQGAAISNGSNGTANVNLRGLGAQRTLVLVNGRRLGPGDPTSGSNFAADLNAIPTALIERVEIMTGGASSVYGADAVSGVVNFIMNTHFEGVRIDAGYSFFNHQNDNAIADVVRDAGFDLPKSNINAGYSRDFSLLLGSNFADDRGNAVFYATYRKTDPVLQGQYDYSACSLDSGDAFGCGGSGTSFPARFRVLDPNTGDRVSYTLDESGTLTPGSPPLYNFGPLNFYMRPDDRYTAGVFLNLQANDHADVYGEFMFMKDRSMLQIAPSGVFTLDYDVSCSNPLWTAEEFQAFCGDFGLTTADTTNIRINRRNVEGGPRQQDLNHSSYRAVVGVRGAINDTWTYDAFGQYGTTSIDNLFSSDFSITRLGRALNVVPDGNGGAVCAAALSGVDPTCVPYNIWTAGGVTPEALQYVQIPLLAKGSVTERVVNASFTGDLGTYGLKFPAAETGVLVNAGLEWRQESSEFSPDATFQTGDGAGQGGVTPPLAGGYTTREVFAEARLPIAENKSLAREISAELGYRYSDYSLDFNTSTYKVGLGWTPIDPVKLRASYQRAARVPNVSELFSTQAVGLDGTIDPCANEAGELPALTMEQCANTGMTAAQYGNVESNPAAQYNGFLGGNPDLKPEKVDTISFGIALQPTFAPGLRVQLDYYDVKVKDAIQAPNADFTLLQCALTGAPELCAKVHRDSAGSLFETPNGYVVDTLENIGELRSKGIDIDASYAFEMGSAGRMRVNLTGTYLDSFEFAPQSGVTYDCVGLYGAICSSGSPNGAPAPEWRHRLNAIWSTPWNGLDLMLAWRYFGSVQRDLEDSQQSLAFLGQATGVLPTDSKLGSRNYIDVSAAMSFAERYTVRVGANNVFDKDPPLTGSGTCPTGPCNGNTWPQSYDALGRQIFMTVSASF